MDCTRFWFIRHALVDAASRAMLYGQMDVGLCTDSVSQDGPAYRALAETLPRPATWIVTPLRRTRETAELVQRAGYPAADLLVEPGLIEQDLGAWQGLRHDELPAKLTDPAHAFWPLGGNEVPPGGESMTQVIARVGATLERLAETYAGGEIVCVSHGGAIRAAVAHAMGVDARATLHFSIWNLSLTVLERFAAGWRVVTVNSEFV